MSTPRRSSYASVVSGNVGSSTTPRPGFLSHLSEGGASSSSTPQQPHHRDRHAPHSKSEGHIDTLGKSQLSHWTSSLEQNTFEPWPDFFVPSYLKGSRHMERLEERYKMRIAAQRDGKSGRSAIGSLSRSSSGANLHKMVPSHRGMTHEIIERPLHHSQEEEPLAELPSRWSTADKFHGIEVAYDGSEAKFNGSVKEKFGNDGFAIRADQPMPKELGIYYFEVTVLSRGRESPIAVGFQAQSVVLNRMPGWEPESWAYHGDDGHSFCQSATGKAYGHKFGLSDVIGCGVNFKQGTAFFTRNGVYIGPAFREIKQDNLYPSVGFKKAGEHIRVNFGQTPFVFDIDGYVKKEQDAFHQEVDSEDVSSLHNSKQERLLQQELIAQYLAHDGYVETAKAFAAEVQQNRRLLSGDSNAASHLEYKEDPDAINRQRIRSAILEGDVDRALVHTKMFYPSVLQENENIYFKLRCRKFIEMIRRCTELQPSSKGKRQMSGKGPQERNPSIDQGAFNGPMDVDDEDDSAMDEDYGVETTADTFTEQNTLMNEALKYGQELQSEFKKDPRREVKQALEDTFALIAYPDARESSLAPLLEPDGRVPVAEELNSAILVSLGKSSNAIVERMYQQSEVLANDLSKGGDVASLVNVRNDYLR